MDKIKVAKELLKLAKSLVANDIDEQTQRRLDEAEKSGKKYILHHDENGLCRIMACKDFGDVKKGDFGGLIQDEENLSHGGKCWVYNDAQVYEGAKIYGDAKIYGNAQVYSYAHVYGKAQVRKDAWVYKDAKVYGDAVVKDYARVSGDGTQVYGDAWVCDKAQVYGGAKICGSAFVDYSVVEDKKITK